MLCNCMGFNKLSGYCPGLQRHTSLSRQPQQPTDIALPYPRKVRVFPNLWEHFVFEKCELVNITSSCHLSAPSKRPPVLRKDWAECAVYFDMEASRGENVPRHATVYFDMEASRGQNVPAKRGNCTRHAAATFRLQDANHWEKRLIMLPE